MQAERPVPYSVTGCGNGSAGTTLKDGRSVVDGVQENFSSRDPGGVMDVHGGSQRQPAPRRGRLLAAAVVIVALGATTLVAVGPAAPAQASAGMPVGVVPDLTWGISRSNMDRTVKAMSDAGVKWARVNVSWSGVEPAKGQLNTGWLSEIDYAVDALRTAGIQVLMPFADGVPYWASGDPAKYRDAWGEHWNKYWKPLYAPDYGAFVATMVNRYKVKGVHTFEIWNEPNSVWFWPSGPRAAHYLPMLRSGYRSAKFADPSATVVLGGLAKNDYTFLQALYAAGGRAYFDVVAVHPYTGAVDPTKCWNEPGTTRLAKNALCGIEEIYKTMTANGDGAKSIWVTEIGWSTTSVLYGVTEAVQADYLTKAMAKLRSYPYVGAAFWYNFRNTWWSKDDPLSLNANYGLLRTDFSPKPAYAAFRTAAGA